MKKSIVTAAFLCFFAIASCAKGNDAGPNDTQALVDRIVGSNIPVLVDFGAVWCMPCRILDPIIEQLEKEYEGRMLFVKVDIDRHPEIAQYFRVSAVPSVYFIEDKTVRAMLPGVRGRQAYVDEIEKVLRMAAERPAAPPTKRR